ncbi:MAG: nucleotide exchange factor GrpE [Alphaproteobacteria bacterium]|nr:nucleotide exchange factor GrpE [Alphaproteobacteria bacterium]
MRGYEPWPTTRSPRVVPLEAAQELARKADEARALAQRAVHENERLRRELARATEALEQTRGELQDALEALTAPVPVPEPAPQPEPEPLAEDARVRELLADLANVRRQRDAQIERVRIEERGEGLNQLADVIDDLERALASHPDPDSPWVQGTVAVLGRVRHAFERAGGVRFGRFGDPFDPNIHDAVGTAPGVPDTVAMVQRSGVRLEDGTLIRPASVLVGTTPPSHEETTR